MNFLLFFSFVGFLFAYNIKTHQEIAKWAFQDVVQTNPELFQQLLPWREVFMEGAVREDCGIDPVDLPAGASSIDMQAAKLSQCFGSWADWSRAILCSNRYNNHFHHPGTNAGLNGRRIGLPHVQCKSSIAWAWNDDTSQPGRKWTFEGAQQWRQGWTPMALEWTSLPKGLQYQDPNGDGRRRQRAAWKLRNFFFNLGHVAHLITDLFQSQHVHNEPHPGSEYERYVDEHLDEFLHLSVFEDAWQDLSSRLAAQDLTGVMEQVANYTYWTSTFTRSQLQTLFVWKTTLGWNSLENAEQKTFALELDDTGLENPLMDQFWLVEKEYNSDLGLPKVYYLENVYDATYVHVVQDHVLFANRARLHLSSSRLATDHAAFYIPLARRMLQWMLQQWIQEFLVEFQEGQQLVDFVEVWSDNHCVSGIRHPFLEDANATFVWTDRRDCLSNFHSTTGATCSMLVRLSAWKVHVSVRLRVANETINLTLHNGTWSSSSLPCSWFYESLELWVDEKVEILPSLPQQWLLWKNETIHDQVHFHDICQVYYDPTTTSGPLLTASVQEMLQFHIHCSDYLSWLVTALSCANCTALMSYFCVLSLLSLLLLLN